MVERIMPNLLTYAELAEKVYDANLSKGGVAKSNGGTETWKIVEWLAGGTEGFQGAILESESDVICAFKGTNATNTAKGKGTLWEDLKADARLTVWMMPKQMTEAIQMVEQATYLVSSSRKRLSIVGHSLGGGLAQASGYATGFPFVTFNAPGMLTNMMLSNFARAKNIRGFNMILASDVVGNFGRHVGSTERFITPGMFVPGYKGLVAHLISTVLIKLRSSPKWANKTIDQLC
jgi:hypothetical protein